MPASKIFTARDAAQVLGIGYRTPKQWTYKKIRTSKTAGGHYRIPEEEIDRFLHGAGEGRDISEWGRNNFRRVSGRNQLVGRVTDIRVDGLLAQVRISAGGQRITSIISADAVREIRLKNGRTVAALIKSTDVVIIRL